MTDFANAFGAVELPRQESTGGGNGGGSNLDYDGLRDKQLELLGGVGDHSKIGVITQLVDLGIQDQDEQVVLWDAKGKTDHGWRLEKHEDSGNPKDATAVVEQRKYRGKMQECLVYTPPAVKQLAVVVDLPEIMFPYGDFFEGSGTTPYRTIIGKEGFITKARSNIAGTMNIVAKPYNLKHTNVNRNTKDAQPHYAIAKNSGLYELAKFCGVLDDNDNFHAQDVGKLIGKAINFDVNVKLDQWTTTDGEPRSMLKVDAKPASKMSDRDKKFYDDELADLIKPETLGAVLMNGNNNGETLKKLNTTLLNTVKISSEFKGSKLEEQLEALGKLGGVQGTVNNSNSAPAPQEKPSKPVEPTVTESAPAFDDSFEDDNL